MVHPDDRAWVKARYVELRQGSEIELSYRLTTPAGEVRHVRELARPQRDAQGRVVLEHGTIQDITALKQAEERLVQAQKMEAVGQLTGGVAHDFNNTLGIMLGNLELAREQAEGAEQLELLDAALRAGRRAAVLTSRLLAFSRRQTLMPEPTHAGQLAENLVELLRRTLGPRIEVRVTASPSLEPCLVDRHQLESALVNLAVNARDAMPEGGKLMIECANASIDDEYAAAQIDFDPGSYVLIAVSDNGSGMAPAVVERAFEPFFTTKEVARGSGLGLSMVHGFAKQSGGHVVIYSEEGKGTTIKLYLPRVPAAETAAEAAEAPGGQRQRVLLVEDNPDLRVMLVNLLQDLRYDVVEAGSGPSALRHLQARAGLNLLLTDVVLGEGMDGRQLAAEARRLHPGLPVLYMSGYTDSALAAQVGLEEGALTIHKPFRKLDLAVALRETLERALEAGLAAR